MIDPSRTRADLLAEIGATYHPEQPASDVTDLREALRDAHIRFSGHDKRHLFSLVKAVLLEAFAEASREELLRDLLIPLRNALGNAAKHGNAHDPNKFIVVDLILTGEGTLVIVADEGDGFDVALTLGRFRNEGIYYQNGGAGFRNLHDAKSIVSFDTGGRALLLCFRPALGNRRPAKRQSIGRTATLQKAEASVAQSPTPWHAALADSKTLDPEWMLSALTADLGDLGKGGGRIASCRIYPHAGRASDGCGPRYAVCLEGNDGRRDDVRVFTGRLHPTGAAATIDFEIGTQLHNAGLKSVRAPKPLVKLSSEPRLVLFQFDPWLNLAEYVSHRASVTTFEKVSKKVARALASLHCRSEVHPTSPDEVPPLEELRTMIARAETSVDALPLRPDLVRRVRQAANHLQERVALIPARSTPIHGALGWNCIHYGADGRFYFYRFENCRRSDPGLDLGGFAADLLCFLLGLGQEPLFRSILSIFISTYNAEASQPIDEDSLRFHIVLALIDRLGRPVSGALSSPRHLLRALDVASRDGDGKRLW